LSWGSCCFGPWINWTVAAEHVRMSLGLILGGGTLG
jgi:hypothetical protein